MDPASAILGIASGATTLVAVVGQTVSYIIDLCNSYRNARLNLLDLMTNLQAFRTAWMKVKDWTAQGNRVNDSIQSDAAVEQILAYVEMSKMVMDLICEDLDRLDFNTANKTDSSRIKWWQNDARPSAKAATQIVLHENIIRQHCERIHRQSASLCLLLSTLQLPSLPLQEAIVEAYQPVFRKDEETAWTIVQTRKTNRTQSRPSTVYSDVHGPKTIDMDSDNAHKGFAFENELFLGPVYKRLLLAKLCENDDRFSRPQFPGTISSSSETPDHPPSKVGETNSTNTTLEGYATTMWEHRVFSHSCTEDLLEFLEHHRPRKLSRRHLPLAVVSRQKDLDPYEQGELDEELFKAVRRKEPEQVARALDKGANINAEVTGNTALQFCVLEWYRERAREPYLPHVSTTIAEFLLLYQECRIPYNFGACNILHLCMHIGGSNLLRQVLPSVDGFLEKDMFDRTPLQMAVLCGDISLGCIQALRPMFPDSCLDPYRKVTKVAWEAQRYAASKGAIKHAEKFEKLALGTIDEVSPERITYIHPSILWTAVRRGLLVSSSRTRIHPSATQKVRNI